MKLSHALPHCLLAASLLTAPAQTAATPTLKPSPDVVAGIAVNYDEAKAGTYTLPDLNYFMHDDGHGMVPGDWDVYVQFLKMHLHPEK